MNDKFKYAPGMPGFGTKGSDGSMGSQGLAMYFTDLDPVSDINSINSRIANSFDLWQNSGNPLPDGRSYVTGDLFFDSNGKAYEINAETDTFTSLGGSLNMGGFFVPLGINSDNGFQRYFNSNSTPKYIIDNIYTDSGAINYTESPINIYGIIPENFARVEYSNVEKIGSQGEPYNPFTVYSSGESVFDDASAIAIVRDASHNLFRIGNIDDAGNLRNISLIFDVSSLIHTKQPGNTFSLNSPLGSILTNYEIAANTIFDPNFNGSPASFFGTMGSVDVSLNWVLSDFTNDSAVTGDLYFFENIAPYSGQTFRIDSSAARPLIFSNVGATGAIRISGISPSKAYGFYMKLSKNGWTRNSDIKYAYLGSIDVSPLSYSEPSSGEVTKQFTVTSNFTWNASIGQNPDNFMSIVAETSTAGLNGTFDVHCTPNPSTNGRLGKIRVGLLPGMATFKDVSIYQPRGVIGPELFLYSPSLSTSNFSYFFYPSYYLDASQNGTIKGGATLSIDVSTNHAWTATGVPSWATLVPSSGSGSTSVTLTVINSNNTVNTLNELITFNFGGDTPVYLYLSQEPVQVWLEYMDNTFTVRRKLFNTPYPLAFTYSANFGSGQWYDYENGSYVDGQYFSFGMKTTNNVALPFSWPIPPAATSWLNGYNLSGTTPTGDSDSYFHAYSSYSPGQNITIDGSIDSCDNDFTYQINIFTNP